MYLISGHTSGYFPIICTINDQEYYKDGLITESFSLWLKSQKKVPNHDPAHYSPKEKMLSVMIWHLFLEI